MSFENRAESLLPKGCSEEIYPWEQRVANYASRCPLLGKLLHRFSVYSMSEFAYTDDFNPFEETRMKQFLRSFIVTAIDGGIHPELQTELGKVSEITGKTYRENLSEAMHEWENGELIVTSAARLGIDLETDGFIEEVDTYQVIRERLTDSSIRRIMVYFPGVVINDKYSFIREDGGIVNINPTPNNVNSIISAFLKAHAAVYRIRNYGEPDFITEGTVLVNQQELEQATDWVFGREH